MGLHPFPTGSRDGLAAQRDLSARAGGPAPSKMRQAHHLLVLPAEVEIEEVELLALSRFPATRWEVAPASGADGLLAPGLLRTSRHTTMIGPYALPPSIAQQVSPHADDDEAGASFVMDVSVPRERGEAPEPGAPDRDGIGAAFVAGLPVREEDRVVRWLIAAARRLGGAVVVDWGDLDPAGPTNAEHAPDVLMPGGHGPDGYILCPDPDALIDLTVFSDVWLAPEAGLMSVRAVAPEARFAPGGRAWEGPPDQLAMVNPAADDFDIAALTADVPPTGYAIHIDLGAGDLIAIEIGGEEVLPASLAGLPWASDGALAYRVQWIPCDFTELELPDPSGSHRVKREQAGRRVEAIARAIHHVVGGEIADQGDFLVNPEDL